MDVNKSIPQGYDRNGKTHSEKRGCKKVSITVLVDEKISEEYIDAFIDTLYETFKAGEGVTLPNLGSFYLDRRRSVGRFLRTLP